MLINMVLPGAVETGPDENTLLLLHGKDFTDSSKYDRTVENHGVSISTAISKFGDSSFYFNGSSWMKIDVSGGAKTLDFWFYTNLAQTSGIYQTPFSLVLSGVRTYMHVNDATSSAYPIYRVIYSGSVIGGNGSTIITRGVWHHIAYCTDGQGNHRFYLDGVLQKSISRTIGEYVHLILGVAADYGDTAPNTASTGFTGYIDEIRVSDVERWTADFTPPTEEYGGTIKPILPSDTDFTYTGNYTDDGSGVVRLNSSGVFTAYKTLKVLVHIVGAGGGAAYKSAYGWAAGGGSGGNQEVEMNIVPGTYEIVIGTGGKGAINTSTDTSNPSATNGGNTSAFGYTSTGGERGQTNYYATIIPGAGGSPNGNAGDSSGNGGSPNGGSVVNGVAQNGGDGYVELTFI